MYALERAVLKNMFANVSSSIAKNVEVLYSKGSHSWTFLKHGNRIL